jgi:hypothetical protein
MLQANREQYQDERKEKHHDIAGKLGLLDQPWQDSFVPRSTHRQPSAFDVRCAV